MMNKLSSLIESISYCLASEKSYNLPEVCKKYGLDEGEEDEAFRSKAKYVRTRIIGKSEEFILNLSKQLINDYQSFQIGHALNEYTDGSFYILTEITRQKLIERLLGFPNLEGNLASEEILVKSNLSHFIQSDALSFFFSDSDKPTDPLAEFLSNGEIYKLLDNQIFKLIEVLVHPIVRGDDQQNKLVAVSYTHLTLPTKA